MKYLSTKPFTLSDDKNTTTFMTLGILYSIDLEETFIIHRHGNYEDIEVIYEEYKKQLTESGYKLIADDLRLMKLRQCELSPNELNDMISSSMPYDQYYKELKEPLIEKRKHIKAVLFKNCPIEVNIDNHWTLQYFIKTTNSGEIITSYKSSGPACAVWEINDIRLPTISNSPKNTWLAHNIDHCPKGAEDLLLRICEKESLDPSNVVDKGSNYDWSKISKFKIIDLTSNN